MARTTAQRRRQRAQYQDKLQHYTERSPRVPTRVVSNSTENVPGMASADPMGSAATLREYDGYVPTRRPANWRLNTNQQLSRGGMSCYPHMREGFAGNSTPATSTVANDKANKSHKHLIK